MNDEQLINEMINVVEDVIRNNMKDQFDLSKQNVLVKTATKEIISILSEKIESDNEVKSNENK